MELWKICEKLCRKKLEIKKIIIGLGQKKTLKPKVGWENKKVQNK